MYGTVEDSEAPVLGAPQTPEFTIARANGVSAIYKRAARNAKWNLVTTEAGDAATTLTVLRSTGAQVTERDDQGFMLDTDGKFPQEITAFVAATAIDIMRAKADDLRRRAKAARYDEGMRGGWGDGGAHQMEAVAEAYEDAIAIVETYATR